LMGVAAKDGKLLWRYARVSKGVVCTTPIVRGDYVFVTGAYAKSGSALVKLTATAAGGMKAEEVYYLDANTFGNHHGGLVLLGDYLYGGHGLNAGLPVCLEFKTGRIVWQADKTPGGATAGSGAVIAADGHLYFRYQNGAVALIEASPAGYKLQSEFNAPRTGTARAWAHPVISDGRLYLRDDDALLCYDLKGKAK